MSREEEEGECTRMRVSHEISTVLKEFGKRATKKELRKHILSQWDEEIAEGSEAVNHDSMKEQFKAALGELVVANKVRIVEDGDETYVEYIRKSSRKEAAQATSSSSSGSGSSSSSSSSSTSSKKLSSTEEVDEAEAPAAKKTKQTEYAPVEKPVGNNTILLFYAYCTPVMSVKAQDNAIAHFYAFLKENGVTGRLRIGREGYNCTLTGPHDAIRKFTTELRRYDSATFKQTDFKYVDGQADNQLLPTLKVFPVSEIVNYGFNAHDAPLHLTGTHLAPKDFHKALENPNAVVIDVRNFNEAVIGKFQPPENGTQQKYLDPQMRRSTEFPEWVEKNKKSWEGKQVLMYCTAGVRCERASAFMRNKGVENVFQLEGGIHRYLDAFPEDGGYWKGKNYTFDKRFSHGAANAECISFCVHCDEPWERYNAQAKCAECKMEVLLCNTCARQKPAVAKSAIKCPLCSPKEREAGTAAAKSRSSVSGNDSGSD